MMLCATCAVEYDEPTPDVCPICADERQYVPAEGQLWTTLDELAGDGRRLTLIELEPSLTGIRCEPSVGIGQQAIVVGTDAGALLWDPPGYVDDATVTALLNRHPGFIAVAASHPHMFGVQLEWAHRLGEVPVLVCESDAEWLGRRDPLVDLWAGHRELADGLTLHQVGGHFVGSAVAHWTAGAEGTGVLLSGDTLFPNPDRATVSFMRSYPNRIPLSAAVVERIADQLESLPFDRIYGNFANSIHSGAKASLRRSAERHARWVRGDFDHLT